jgi:hypothetical protein
MHDNAAETTVPYSAGRLNFPLKATGRIRLLVLGGLEALKRVMPQE